MHWKSILAAAAMAFGLFIAYRFSQQQFHLDNIQATWPAENIHPISIEDKQRLDLIFKQPFRYIDRGKQSYVFVSQDGQTILKFFDTRCTQSGSYPLINPLSLKKCTKKMQQLLNGYTVAENFDRENTGLIFVQLSPNPSYTMSISVTDRFGFKHNVEMSKVPFALQKRAIPTREAITGLLSKGDVEGAVKLLQKIIDMYIQEYQHGVIDGDHNLMYNTGIADGKPMRIDVGRLRYDEKVKDPAVYANDLHKVAVERVGEWLQRHFPQYRQAIEAALER